MTRARTRRTAARTSSSPRSELMTQKIFGVLLAAVLVSAATPARAANKEHQQMMADLRMLQEQSQLLQNMLGTLAEAIKAVNTRLDQQGETTRKAFADQKLQRLHQERPQSRAGRRCAGDDLQRVSHRR